MKKYTKVLAAFCAMTMIFSAFSASVFAEEIEPQTEPTVEAAEENGNEKQDENQGKDQVENLNGNQDENQDDDQDKDQNLNDNQNEDQGSNTDGSVSDDANKDADGETDADTASEEGQGDPADVTGNDEDAQKPDIADGTEPEPERPLLRNVRSATPPFADGNITQDEINANDGMMPTAPGSYTLTEDVTVSKGANVETNDTAITIDLNGHTITYTGTESMYVLGRIRGTAGDNAEMATTPINWEDCATGVVLTIQGTGTITGAGTTGHGSSDYWINGSGVGVDGKLNRGGCVLIEYGCKFILNGGTITGFEAKDEGGAVCASNGSEFIMNGGTISNCSSKNGGAVSGQASSKTAGPGGENICSLITINGGTIENNEASAAGGGIFINRGKLLLYGGHVLDNNAKSNGGGIAFVQGPHGNVFELKGSPQVCGNTFNGQTNVNKANIFLGSGVVMKLTGDLYTAATLYVGTQSTANEVEIIKTNNQSFDINSIHSDIPSKKAYYNGSSLIKLKPDNDPKIEGYQLVVGGEIKLRVAVSLADYANSDTTVDYAYYYLKGTTRVDKAKTVNFTDLATSGSYYTFEIPIESACMTSPITVTINYGSNETVTDDPVTIEKYVFAILDGNYAQDVKDAVNALYIFGTVAMLQFDINRSDPALKPQSREIDGNVYSPTSFKYEIGEGAPYTPATDPDGAFYGASVNFLSKTEVNLYFKKSELGATAPSMTVTYSGNVTDTISATENGSYYVYTVKGPSGDGFAATLFDVPFSFSVGNVSGEYSIDTYLQVVEYKYHGQTDNILLILCEKYYDYAKKFQQL